MKSAKTSNAPSIRQGRALILLGVLAAVLTTIACSTNSKPAAATSQPVSASLLPAKLDTAVPTVTAPAPTAAATKATSPMQPPAKVVTYRSRNYGVSFLYPWQYAFLSAKAVATGDASRRPKSDGYEGQFALARIEIPKGFYPDSDFESGYFILSLNQDLNELECQAVVAPAEGGTVQTDTINGVEFRWIETESGGHGSAVKLRHYVAFTNATCYELELGVQTKNEDGLAKEVDPDQVLRRLDAILRTVKFVPEKSTAVAAK